jgi:hypothetical protein
MGWIPPPLCTKCERWPEVLNKREKDNKMKMQLPIDQVDSPNGLLLFRWRQLVSSPIGETWVEHQGQLPPTVEAAVSMVIGIAKKLTAENEELRRGEGD